MGARINVWVFKSRTQLLFRSFSLLVFLLPAVKVATYSSRYESHTIVLLDYSFFLADYYTDNIVTILARPITIHLCTSRFSFFYQVQKTSKVLLIGFSHLKWSH